MALVARLTDAGTLLADQELDEVTLDYISIKSDGVFASELDEVTDIDGLPMRFQDYSGIIQVADKFDEVTLAGVGAAVTFVGFNALGAPLSSTTLTIDYPSGTTAGDLVLVFFGTGRDNTTVTTPSGWTLVDSYVYTAAAGYVFSKIAGAETSVTATYSLASATAGASIISFRGGSVTDSNNDMSGASIDPPSVSATSDGFVACFGMAWLSTASNPTLTQTGYTVTNDMADTVTDHYVLHWISYKAITSTGTEDPPAVSVSGNSLATPGETVVLSVAVSN